MSKENQLVIDSIERWTVEGIDKFEYGLSIDIDGYYDAWNNGSAMKLNGYYCSRCNYSSVLCSRCPLDSGSGHDIKTYMAFRSKPSLKTCRDVIDEMFNNWRG